MQYFHQQARISDRLFHLVAFETTLSGAAQFHGSRLVQPYEIPQDSRYMEGGYADLVQNSVLLPTGQRVTY